MTANELASAMIDSASDTAEKMGDKTDGLRRSAERAVESRRKAAAEGLASAAERLHRRGDDLPGGERVTNLAHGTADRIEATADFLRDHDTKAMVGNVKEFVRKHPGKSLAVAAVIGFLAARALRED